MLTFRERKGVCLTFTTVFSVTYLTKPKLLIHSNPLYSLSNFMKLGIRFLHKNIGTGVCKTVSVVVVLCLGD